MTQTGHPAIQYQTWDNAILCLAALRTARSQGVLSLSEYRKLHFYEGLVHAISPVTKEDALKG